ncbi:hypothetical protein MSG28_012425 [Choristoneura fumiferana]|uniref:Uncharacterized protein n=1 Tax=Choristoneura fumiferana TaxID=7141 RepID=A0ACC0KDV5_CHOFU|nr:hypothetical protein MSG28_012425 [Choristoneura fumiferana]
MNVPESAGESSSKRQENGDASPTRPLKKARFAWQVKGKYHLKNGTPEHSKTSSAVASELDRASSSSDNEIECNGAAGNTEQNLERLGDYLLKPSTSLSPDKLNYPRYASSYDNNSSSNSISSCGNSQENRSIPMSMVVSASFSEDQCIARWQARQMAKGFVDNTINRVLDSWMVAPLPTEMDNNRFLALDVAEFINNLPGDNSIENEGILMAISAHGLQNTSSSSSNEDSQNDEQEQPCSYMSVKDDAFPSPPSSPIQSDERMRREPVELKQNDDDALTNELDLSWYSDTVKRNMNSDVTPFTFFPESSTSSYQYYTESEQPHSPSIDYDAGENVNSSGADILTSHFLDAAVSFAIQNKGLTSDSGYG